MVLKPTLEKEASEILPELEGSLLAGAVAGDVFENICSKPDIGLCAEKARSSGDLSKDAFFEEPPLLVESCKSEDSLSDCSFNFDSDCCSETPSPAEEQPDSGKVFSSYSHCASSHVWWNSGSFEEFTCAGGFNVQRGSG